LVMGLAVMVMEENKRDKEERKKNGKGKTK
jgi:hypothetical protein